MAVHFKPDKTLRDISASFIIFCVDFADVPMAWFTVIFHGCGGAMGVRKTNVINLAVICCLDNL